MIPDNSPMPVCRKQQNFMESISRMATVQSYSHCSDVWPLFSRVATVQSYGHCSVVWPLFSLVAAVRSCGHCSVVWPLFSHMATVQSYGRCSVVWPLFSRVAAVGGRGIHPRKERSVIPIWGLVFGDFLRALRLVTLSPSVLDKRPVHL